MSYKDKKLFDQNIGNKFKLNGIKVFLVKRNLFIVELFTMIITLTRLLFSYDIKNYYCRSFWGAIVTKLSLFYKSKNLIRENRVFEILMIQVLNIK